MLKSGVKKTPITFKKPRFKSTDSKLNHKSHHTVTPHLLRGPSRQRLDFIGCGQMDPATSAGGQCGGGYWFYSEFVDLSHNSLSVIGVVLKFTPHPNPLPQGERGVDREKFRQVLIRNWRLYQFKLKITNFY